MNVLKTSSTCIHPSEAEASTDWGWDYRSYLWCFAYMQEDQWMYQYVSDLIQVKGDGNERKSVKKKKENKLLSTRKCGPN